jgi:alkylation response protein AidB-like acyl-CoA dehydrogenase
MKLAFTEEQEKLRQELRAYFANMMTPELKEELRHDFKGEGGGPLWKATMRQLGKDGWIGLGWPKSYGGMEKGAMEQYIFFSEILKSGFPFNFLTSESVGPALAQFGGEAMKQEIIPQILAGEINICIGYSEPSAGTDLASLKTRAVKEGNEYVINGQKIFTSLAEFADYIWLATKTGNEDEKGKHGSISMFLIPMNTPGISITPIYTLGSVRTNATYLQDVRVPATCLVGEENKGWQIIMSQLNRERLALVTHGPSTGIFKKVCNYAAGSKLPNGERLIDQGWVKMNLAKARQGFEAMRMICYKQAWAIATTGNLDMAEASAAKVYGSEFMIEGVRGLMEILGYGSTLHMRSEHNILEGELERLYRTLSILTFGGGTNEIQRDIISIFGLSMPRPLRA